MAPLRVAVLASGEGTTLEGLAESFGGTATDAQIVLVVSNRAAAPVLGRAERHGIPTRVVPSAGRDREEFAADVTRRLEEFRVDLVVLAGFLAILPASWVGRWRGRAINLHPSLLPRYGGRGMYGLRVHAAVLAAGERESGATVHLVTGDVDHGPPIAQERVAIVPGDTPETLRARIHPVEVRLLATTIRAFASGALPLPYPERAARPFAERPEPARRA